MRPNFHPEGQVFDDSKLTRRKGKADKNPPITQLWHLKGRCPEGTVPIRRTKEEDILRSSSVELFGKKNNKSIPQPPKSADLDLISQIGHEVLVCLCIYIYPYINDFGERTLAIFFFSSSNGCLQLILSLCVFSLLLFGVLLACNSIC